MKYLICLLLALLLTGCRASKKITEEVRTSQVQEQQSDSGHAEIKDLSVLSRRFEELKTESEEVNIILTKYSPPDSTGKQHKTSAASIRYNRNTDKAKQEKDSLVQMMETTIEKSRNTERNGMVEQREREHKEKPPERWLTILLVVIILAAGYGTYRKMKRI